MKKLTHLLSCIYTGVLAASFSYPAAAAPNPNDKNDFSLGVEGFYDAYNEPQIDVNINTYYGSITGKWIHKWNPFFTALDGRYSVGTDNYSSPSGTFSGAVEDETDDRIRVGANLGAFAPYLGLGVRYFVDNGKGEVTSLGAFGYDRRITQLYAPIGITYTHTTDSGWILSPNIEFDPLLYGNVNSRLGTVPGFYNINNTQHSGYGVRGEFMVGWNVNKLELQCGPFVRYWNIHDSDVTTDPAGNQWIEPHNNRTQYGLAFRMLW